MAVLQSPASSGGSPVAHRRGGDMARLCLVIDVPGWSGEQLKQAVHDIDATDDAVPIAVEHVDVKDIFTYVFGGHIGVTHKIVFQAIQEDAEPRKPWGEVFPPKIEGLE